MDEQLQREQEIHAAQLAKDAEEARRPCAVCGRGKRFRGDVCETCDERDREAGS